MVKIDLGEYVPEVHTCDADPECPNRGQRKSEYPVSPVKTVVTSTFATDNPDVAEFMKNLAFTNAQMNGLLAWKDENEATAEEAAVYFLTTFPDVWSAWINDSAKNNLSFLLNKS